MSTKRQQRRRQYMVPGTVDHFPQTPGWWVQWSGRTDWQPMDAGSARILEQIIVANGDKVVQVFEPACE